MDIRKEMYQFMRRNGNLLAIIFWYTLLIVIVTTWSMTVIVKAEDREIVKTKIIYVYRDQVIPEILPTPEIITKELEPWAQNAVKENEVAEYTVSDKKQGIQNQQVMRIQKSTHKP